MFFSQDQVQLYKQRVDIEKFVRDHFERVSGSAPQLYARCTGHDDSQNSLSINTSTGQWTCHAGCNADGKRDLYELVQLMFSFPKFYDAVQYVFEYLEQGNVRKLAHQVENVAENKPAFAANDAEIEECQERLVGSTYWLKFLESKKISREIAERFKVGVDTRLNLVLPAIDIDNKTRGVRFRSQDKHRWWDRASDPAKGILFGQVGSGPLFVCEGETDAMAMLSAGWQSVVAVYGASVKWNPDWTPLIKDAEKIILCGDNDQAGRDMNRNLYRSMIETGIPEDRIQRVNWGKVEVGLGIDMPPHFDVNDALMTGMTPKQIAEAGELVPSLQTEMAATEISGPVFAIKDDRPKLHPDAWLPILATVRDALHARLGSPDALILGGLLPLVSHTVGRRATTNLGGKHILAMYSLLVAPTNSGKSAVLDYLHNELTPEVDRTLRPFGTTINKMGVAASAEGMGKTFKQNFAGDYRGLAIINEFSIQLQKAKSEGGGPIIQALCDLWYGSYQSSTTKMTDWDLDGKHLAIAAASTQVWVHHHIRKPDLQGGFANRFMYWMGFMDEVRPMDFTFPPDDGIINQFIQTLVAIERRLGRHQGKPVEIVALAEANSLWKGYCNDLRAKMATQDEIQVSLTARVRDHTARVAALYCLLEGTEGITATQMQRAILVGDYLFQSALYMYKDFDASPKLDAQNWIVEQLVANSGRINKRDLQLHVPQRHRENYSLALTDLQRQGVLTDEKNGRKLFWVLTESDVPSHSAVPVKESSNESAS